jgi:hypothetical protein
MEWHFFGFHSKSFRIEVVNGHLRDISQFNSWRVFKQLFGSETILISFEFFVFDLNSPPAAVIDDEPSIDD